MFFKVSSNSNRSMIPLEQERVVSLKHCSLLLGRAAEAPEPAGRGTGRSWYRREHGRGVTIRSPKQSRGEAFQVPPPPCSDGSIRASGGNHSRTRRWEDV